MLTSFGYRAEGEGAEARAHWELSARSLNEHWHPQPFFDLVRVESGRVHWTAEEGTSVILDTAFLVGPGARLGRFRATEPVVLVGTRRPLAWQGDLPERSSPAPAPLSFEAISRHGQLVPTTGSRAASSDVSARHRRRLHRNRFGVSAEKLSAIIAVQEFIDAGCPGSPRDSVLVESVNFARFYDQSHFSRTFRAIVGVPPSAYVDRDSAWVEALMAISSKLSTLSRGYGDGGRETP
ncbi:MAG: hypothetical protein RJQ01_04705 [Microcella sp.]|uniref:hypothetical protein n=1 Tax=Microcella sp. TaxID=1913979 RepID=UPI0033147CA2